MGAGSPMVPASTPAPKHHHPAPPTIVLHQKDNGATIKAKVGQQIDIVLSSPWQMPDGWTIQEVNGDAVEYLGPGPSVTAAGTSASISVFRFQAVQKGNADISLLCEPPPWSMSLVRLLFEVTVDVRP
jgi:predicted secreted protein